jgi:hypothetical protein
MSTINALVGVFYLLSVYNKLAAATNPTIHLRRQVLGDPNNPDKPRPFDPQPGTPLLVDPPRSLNTCHNFMFESAVLYASCVSGVDGSSTSPSVNLNHCIKNLNGTLVYEAE